MNTFLFLIGAFVLGSFIYASFSAAPWVPMRKSDIKRFLELAEIKSAQKVYDLGCGDGRLVCAAAKSGADAEGFEISAFPYLLAQARKFFTKCVFKIRFTDFWSINLGDADIVYFFLTPKILLKMKTKFEKELKKGTKVICYVWPIPGWNIVKTSQTENRPKMFLYEV